MVNSLLSPNDKQDVILMIKLLNAIASLPECKPNASPTVITTHRILHLTHLSAAVHLILALYHSNKGDFIPVQLYFDVVSMIKNIYISVGKTQIDSPTSKFWIILLGTDGLEKVFGKVQTMVGGDTNADQLQLTNCIDGAVQCINILEEHPEWGADSWRLML
ncbi:hypothetical protein BDQ17DRAFT_1433746 [Cyathus striatus]|nr:hypothetical protein BDQ17DRAFT_1433746 [Cyathus striatus]